MSSSPSDCEIYTYITRTPKKRKISAYKHREKFFKSENKARRSTSNYSTDIFSYRSIPFSYSSTRKDFYGTPITKESRKHRVTFKDEINKGELVDVYIIKETDNKPYSKKSNINKKHKREEDIVVHSSKKVNSSKRKEKGEKVMCKACVVF